MNPKRALTELAKLQKELGAGCQEERRQTLKQQPRGSRGGSEVGLAQDGPRAIGSHQCEDGTESLSMETSLENKGV